MSINQKYNKSIKQASEAILSAKTIAIVSHINPDGDTLGCSLALANILRGTGKKIHLLNASNLPKRFEFLPGYKKIKTEFDGVVDLAVSVDCAGADRVGQHAGIFSKARQTLEIDHHIDGLGYCQISALDTEAASTAEVMYDVIKTFNIDISKPVATCLMTALITDTLNFSISATRSKTLRVAAQMIDIGVDVGYISNQAIKLKTPTELKIQGHAFDGAKFDCDNKLVVSILKQTDFARFNATMDDAEEVSTHLMCIRGVHIAVFFRQRLDGLFRTSLRSIAKYNLSKIAKKYNGGGHKNAAGCTLHKQEINLLLNDLKKVVADAL